MHSVCLVKYTSQTLGWDGEMFVNLETTVLQELVNAEADRKWNVLVARLLRADQRELVVGRIANAIQRSIYDYATPSDPLVADLYTYALKRVDFYTIALELVQAAEAVEPCRVHESERPLAA
jgi:hypothetical protein